MSTARILVRQGEAESEYSLSADTPFRIGRNADNTLFLADELISRHHAMLQAGDGGTWSLYDLNSRNGTFLNGRRLTGVAELNDGDQIRIGNFDLVFVCPQEAPRRAPDATAGATMASFAMTEVTVLVVDVRGFTVLARDLGEARIAELMGAFNREAGAILERAGAWGIKYIGDAVMAVWTRGSQVAAVDALLTALHAVRSLSEIAASLTQRFALATPIRLGAGINVGLASVGNIGSGSSADYTALGDVVNKAFRLEASTRVLEADIAFGREVKFLLDSVIDSQALITHQRMELKGYSEPVDVYAATLGGLDAIIAAAEIQR